MIQLNNVTKTYTKNSNSVTPVKELNMLIAKGETVILSGPSGSGKSTVLNIIAGLIKPTSGSVQIEDNIISKLPEQFAALYRREHIGLIFQQFHLIEDMSTTDNIALHLLPENISKS